MIHLDEARQGYIPLPLSFATFRAPESESVIRHLDVIRIRQAGTGGLRQPAKKFLYFLLTPAAPWFLGTEARSFRNL
jgi:hypothetical protein